MEFYYRPTTSSKQAPSRGIGRLIHSKILAAETAGVQTLHSGSMSRRHLIYEFFAVLGFCTSSIAFAGEPITISVESRQALSPVSNQALDLSFETSQLLPDKNGTHYFRPDNKDLVDLLKVLEIESLRIGGNSVDAASTPVPDESDIDLLFDFARVAGVKVLFSSAVRRIHGRIPVRSGRESSCCHWRHNRNRTGDGIRLG
jgi:hypothetical protein